MVFPKVYEKCTPLLQEDAVLLIHGRASVSADGEGKVIAADIKNLEQNEAGQRLRPLYAEACRQGRAFPSDRLRQFSENITGMCRYIFMMRKRRQKMKADRINWVTGEEALCEELRLLLGEKNVALKY